MPGKSLSRSFQGKERAVRGLELAHLNNLSGLWDTGGGGP